MFQRSFNRALLLLLLLPAPNAYSMADNAKIQKKIAKETRRQTALAYHTSDKYIQECEKVINEAIAYLENISNATGGAKKIVLFDVDETVLSAGGVYYSTPQLYENRDWTPIYNSTELPAIPHIKRLYDYCISRSFGIIFLSTRSTSYTDSTTENLKLHGYHSFMLILKPNDNKSSSFKESMRKNLTEQGYCIVACAGDRECDFRGGNTGYKIMMPNRFYD